MSLKALASSLLKDTFIYGIGNACNGLVYLVTAPLLMHRFAPSEYGGIVLLQTTMMFFVMLAGFNLNSGAFFFYYKADNDQDRIQILSTTAWTFVVLAAVSAGVLWLAAPVVTDFLQSRRDGASPISIFVPAHARILAIGIFFSLVGIYFQSLFRLLRRPVHYCLISLVGTVLNFVFVLWLVTVRGGEISSVLWAGVFAQIGVCLLGGAMAWQSVQLKFHRLWLRRILAYCLPQFPSVVLGWMLVQSNRYFLNGLSTPEQQGYYSIAYQVASVFLACSMAFRMAWTPLAMSTMKTKDARSNYAAVYSGYMVVMSLLAGGLGLFAKPILIAVAPVAYHAAFPLVFVIAFAFLFRGANDALGIGICLSEKTRFISYAQLVAFLVNLLLNIVLIPQWNAWGAGWALVGGMIAQNIAYYMFAQRVYAIPYAYYRMHMVAAVVLLVNLIACPLLGSMWLVGGLFVSVALWVVMSIGVFAIGVQRKHQHELFEITAGWSKRRFGWAGQ